MIKYRLRQILKWPILKWLGKPESSFYVWLNVDRQKRRGLKIGTNCIIGIGVVFDEGHAFRITIGNNVTIASYTILLCHDGSTTRPVGYEKIGKITIGDNVFIGIRSIIMPGVTIGENSIIGAGSVVTKSIPANVVAAGNPAEVTCDLSTYIETHKARMKVLPCFDREYSVPRVDKAKRDEMNEKMTTGEGYRR